ncbi:hypothetical protein AB4Y45_27865 [Paraburkholderia sp. EG287A]|uniref:hypothetical protein n=1 Tax=Paraburkholderia sp. EG287A TaxID=3237012 RepID=UPI0034D2B8F0
MPTKEMQTQLDAIRGRHQTYQRKIILPEHAPQAALLFGLDLAIGAAANCIAMEGEGAWDMVDNAVAASEHVFAAIDALYGHEEDQAMYPRANGKTARQWVRDGDVNP